MPTFDYTGGAHEVIGETSLNWDVGAREAVLAERRVRDGKAMAQVRHGFLHARSARRSSPSRAHPTRIATRSNASSPTSRNWLWGADAATVHFTVYTIASFSGGESDVDIPYDVLKPYLRPDAPRAASLTICELDAAAGGGFRGSRSRNAAPISPNGRRAGIDDTDVSAFPRIPY